MKYLINEKTRSRVGKVMPARRCGALWYFGKVSLIDIGIFC